jgi:predicted nucleotidyltransferase
MLTSTGIMKKLQGNRSRIKGYGVKKIGLFGSYVRGEEKKESDVDILVQFEKGKKNFDNYMDLKLFLEDLLKSKVDLVISEAVKPDLKASIFGSVRYAPGI